VAAIYREAVVHDSPGRFAASPTKSQANKLTLTGEPIGAPVFASNSVMHKK
jgi:hypothetical protein